MSDHDCPLWPDVQRLRGDNARLDARVRALELHGPREPASVRLLGWWRWVWAGRPPRERVP